MTDKTLVTFILDRSGSMSLIHESTMEAFNAYVDGMREEESIDFTLVQFDTGGIDKTWFETPIKSVPRLDKTNYAPRGGTPLIDAVFKTIRALEKAVDRKKTDGTGEPKVVVSIQTDGEENASKDHTWSELKELIGQKQAEGWQFNFMGAGIDAYQQSARMGLSADATVSYDSSDLAATRSVFASAALNSVNYATGVTSTTNYTASQKMSAGDRFDPSATTWGVGSVSVSGLSGGLDLGGGSSSPKRKSDDELSL